ITAVNMSLDVGSSGYSQIAGELSTLWNNGVFIGASSGNGYNYNNIYSMPAGSSYAMSVAAENQNQTISSISSRGPSLDIAAPGHPPSHFPTPPIHPPAPTPPPTPTPTPPPVTNTSTRTAFNTIQAESFNVQSGGVAKNSSTITSLDSNDYVGYKGVNFGSTGATKFIANIGIDNAYAGRAIFVTIDGPLGKGRLLGTLKLYGTGSWNIFRQES